MPSSQADTESTGSSDVSLDVDLQFMTGATPEKYALNLMDTLFTDEEMKEHLFIKSERSKSIRKRLCQDRVKQLLGKCN